MDEYVNVKVVSISRNAQGKVYKTICENCGNENIIYFWSYCGSGKRCCNCKKMLRIVNE